MSNTTEPEERRNRGEGQVHSAERARGAEIILRSRWRKIVFFSGLIGFVLLVLIIGLLRAAGS